MQAQRSSCYKGVLVDVLFNAKEKAAQAQVCYEPYSGEYEKGLRSMERLNARVCLRYCIMES